MSSLAFVTHPSVRIKGTENAYTPTQCLDELCPVKAPHLHCPFCVKTDAYQDPVILKAHYRVKHVDKGIEFAGLKILRCCDQCDIIGIIKGEKRFKGAHWHCYRCRNGFNRRDEAIKHYKTHFRNPQTTFQIQITQDLNSPPILRTSTEDQPNSAQDAFSSVENPTQEIIHPALSQSLSITEQSVLTADATNRVNNKVQKVKVKPEPVDKELEIDGDQEHQTIMIIQGDQLESAFASHIINSGDLSVLNKGGVDTSLSWEIRYRMEEEEKNMYKSKAHEYKSQVELLQQQVENLESQLAQQRQLKLQEVVDGLNVGNANKQMLGLQLTKLLEQTQTSQGSAIITDNIPSSHQEEQLHSTPTITPHLEESVDSPTQHIESNANISHSFSSNSASSPLPEIPVGYQVISTTPEGHVIVSKVSKVPEPSVQDEGMTILHNSDSCTNGIDTPVVAVHEPNQVNSAQKQIMEEEEMIAQSVLLEDVRDSSEDLVGQSDARPNDSGTLSVIESGEDSLLQVVAAADGLASLGSDVAVLTSSGGDQENQESFVVEIGNGHKIMVQRADSIQEEQRPQNDQLEETVEEPLPKRFRVAS